MATNTTNYNLEKPASSETYDIAVQNSNMDIIDTAIKARADDIGAKASLLTTAQDNLVNAVNELFTSASDGKTAVAAAITGMGQAASGSDTFAQLAAKIADISDDADAGVGDVLTGKTFYQGGSKKTGTMPNNGTVNITPSTANQTIAAGKHSGTGVVYGDSDLVASNIKSGVNIFGVAGNLTPVPSISAADTYILYRSDKNYLTYNFASGYNTKYKYTVRLLNNCTIRLKWWYGAGEDVITPSVRLLKNGNLVQEHTSGVLYQVEAYNDIAVTAGDYIELQAYASTGIRDVRIIANIAGFIEPTIEP